MDDFAKIPDSDRNDAFLAASQRRRIGAGLLEKDCRAAIKESILPALTGSFAAALGDTSRWKLELAADDPDQQTLVFY
ncbi:MAG TPA: hypothetical protein VM008_07580 [Phycisphaerae bacterium]|nr:hypothetical protein [Phycisphaerae bacterium]